MEIPIMIIPRTPAKFDIFTLFFSDFRRFNTETEDIREMLVKNGLQPYMYDRSMHTNIPFKSVIPNNIWRDTYEKANAETDPEMVFYYFAKHNNEPILVVCAAVETIDTKYDLEAGKCVEIRKEMWKCDTYVRGCSTHGYEDSIEKVIAKCRK
jgi:hypothetical protein